MYLFPLSYLIPYSSRMLLECPIIHGIIFALHGKRLGHASEKEALFPLLKGRLMARGRTTSLTIRLTAEERQTLLAWQRATTISAGRARRGRMILLIADRVPLSHIADTVGISRRFVYKWAQRFLQDGLQGLEDKPGRGQRRVPRQRDLREQRDVDARRWGT